MNPMLRLLLAVPPLVFALLSFAPSAANAFEKDKVPCYCQYPATGSNWDSVEKLWCPNEVFYAGDINAWNAVDGTTSCQVRCASLGLPFIGIASIPATEWENYGNAVNMLADEKEFCVFDKDKPDNYQKWQVSHNDCKEPLNSVDTWPNACSYCYCTYKEGSGTPAECVGKTKMIHATSFPGKCDQLCKDQGYSGGEAADNHGDRCDFSTSDKCATPTNIKSENCARLQQAVEEGKLNITTQGSVLTLPLPLSNIGVSGVVSRLLKAVMGVVGAIALIMFVVSGLRWMLARGNAEEIGKAKKSMTWAALGLIAIMTSYTVLSLVIKAFTGK